MDYENDMDIDADQLDVEWLEQANLAFKYGRHWADCRAELLRTEENIKLVRSEIIKQVNQDPERYLGEGVKPTAPVVEAFYRNARRHQKAKKEWVDAQFEANVAEIAYKEISYTRKMALENLVKLHGQSYFAGPAVPHDISELKEKRKEAIQHRVGASLTKTSENLTSKKNEKE